MTALDIIRNIVLLSGIEKLIKEQAAWFYWEEFDHKLWINAMSEEAQKKDCSGTHRLRVSTA